MKRFLAMLAIVTMMTVSLAVPVSASNFTDLFQMENWTTTGILDGITEIIPASGQADEAQFKYDVDYGVSSGVSYRTVTFSTTSPITADITFDWNYWFWHSWFAVQGDLWVYADSPSGMTTVQLVDHNGGGPVTETGTYTIHVNEGYSFGFTMGGGNFDWASYLHGILTISEVVVEQQIDIKPWSDPNSINTKAKGVIPVAILGSSDLDVTSIDYAGLELYFGPELGVSGARPVHNINVEEVFIDHIVYPWVQSDPDGIPDTGDEVWVTANDDLIPDLVAHFNVEDAGFVVGDENGYLWGEINGVSFYGVDAVNIVK